jgi:hypothetical protein
MVVKALSPEITEIDQLARQYADAQMALDGLTNDLKVVIDAAVRQRWADLKRATTRAAERYEALYAAVSEAQSAFDKPKTRIMHSIRVGFRKANDTVEVLNEANTCALIKKQLPEQRDVLISTTEKPVMSALQQLEDPQLKLIGCKRVIGKDEPVVKLADTDLDKVVAALMKGAIEKAEAA